MESDLKILNFDSSILKFSSCLTEHLESKYNPFAEAKKIETSKLCKINFIVVTEWPIL